MTNAPGHVSSDYLRTAAERARAFKARTHALLDLHDGDRVLDAGCGPGLDTCEMARLVGATGQVWGIDSDAAMIAEACVLAASQGMDAQVLHRVADATALPFAAGEFQAVRAERLLQVLPPGIAPQVVVRELWRVLAPGGILLLADADWGSASLDCDAPDLERRLLAFFARHLRPNGFAGRQLAGLLQEVGGTPVLEVHALVHHDLALLPFGSGLVDKALAAGVIAAEEGRWWLQFLQERSSTGRLYASVNMVIATARKLPGRNNT